MKKFNPFIISILMFFFIVTLVASNNLFTMKNFDYKKSVYTSAEKVENEDSLNITSKSALLYDAKSGTIVYEKDCHKRLPIASMTKIASLFVIFDAIEQNKLSEDTLVKISNYAAETEGSSAFLDEGSEYKVSDLIMTVIVCSANDSTVALAEAVAGSEDAFVKMMNSKVQKLGLKDTNFTNSTGLPAIDHYSSAYDISKFYELICDNTIYRKYSKVWLTELVHPSGRKTEIVNTNKLIRTYEGCDSGKTGYTNSAKYCLSASATRGGMRLIGVVIGAEDSKTRFNEMKKLFNYGFTHYENKVVVSQGQVLKQASVSNSLTKQVDLYAKNNFVKFLKKGENFEYTLNYKINKLQAPLKKGQSVGKLYVLDKNNIVVFETDLIINHDVEAIKIGDILNKIYKRI